MYSLSAEYPATYLHNNNIQFVLKVEYSNKVDAKVQVFNQIE